MKPGILGVHETVVYAADVGAAASFYRDVMGFAMVSSNPGHSAALRVPVGDAMVLIFEPGHAGTPGRGVPTHGATGPGHVAFRVERGTLDVWTEAFEAKGVPIEMDRTWERGGRSVYVRDPGGNSVELVDGVIWPDAQGTRGGVHAQTA